MLLSYVLRSQLHSKVKKLPDMFALQTQYFPNHSAARLAIVDYAPDGKGVSGKDNWRWNMFSAAESGPTDAELKAEKSGTLYLSLEKAPAELADVVEGSAPLK